MKLLVGIHAPEWTSRGTPREQTFRAGVFAAALRDIADKLVNCGADEGTIERDDLSATFVVEFPDDGATP